MNAQSLLTKWWSDAAVYQVYPRSFFDENGDALGDLAGVQSKLSYLLELGINAIWLSPFYPSPQHDSGYDVADQRGVDPMYGVMTDVDELIESAHELGLKIMVDLVPNHVSIEHPWFAAALASSPGSVERSRFHFVDSSDGPQNNWASMFGGPAWTRIAEKDGSPGQWYLHVFDSSQPDLNWTNPEVAADWISTLKFWLDAGVDGFRVDVAHGLAKDMTYANLPDPIGLTQALRFDLDDGSPEAAARRLLIENSGFFDRDELQEIYRTWREVLDSYPGDRMAVCEAWVPAHRAGRYVSPTSLHQIFGFDFLVVPWDSEIMQDTIYRAIAAVEVVGAPPTWALSNHDSPRVVTRLGGGLKGLARARALAMVAHALPGCVYVYQGEELGLPDAPLADSDRQDPVFFRTNGSQKGRDGARVPLPWSGNQPPYGFTESVNPTWLPQPRDWAQLTVSSQQDQPSSTLSLYSQSLKLRAGFTGAASFMESGDSAVMIFHRDQGIYCVINTGNNEYLLPEFLQTAEVLLDSESVRALGDKTDVLPPDCARWFRVTT